MSDERRRYFRIVDTVEVGVRPLTDDESGDLASVLGQYADIDRLAGKLHEELIALQQKHPELIALMTLMNQKIDMVRGMIDRDLHPGHRRHFQTRNIDLSACGVSFPVFDSYPAGTLLLLEMNLPSPFRAARAVAEVVGCDPMQHPQGEDRYLLRLDFAHIHDADQEMLIQYLMRRQVQELKARRESRDNA